MCGFKAIEVRRGVIQSIDDWEQKLDSEGINRQSNSSNSVQTKGEPWGNQEPKW